MGLTDAVSGSVWKKKRATISASTTMIIDSFPEGSFEHFEYVMHFRNASRSKIKSFILSVSRINTDVNDILYAKQGSLNVKITTRIIAGKYELEVQNVETFHVELSLARLRLT